MPSFWKLVGENIELVNLRLFGKQIAALRLFHQRRCHLAVEANRVSVEPVSVSWETGFRRGDNKKKNAPETEARAVAETDRRIEGPPIAGICCLFGKSPFAREC